MYIGRQMLAASVAAAAALAAAPALVAAPTPADVKSGVDAWARGDFAGAVKQWRPLASAGDPDAQFNMGQAYKLGRGVPADLRIAQSWYQKAAAQGHQQAQGFLGLILYEGGKRREAMPWIRKAADRGDARAQYVLGIELTNGDLIKQDWPRAYALMTRSAAQGIPAAARSLVKMEQFIPAPQRQAGIALARQMERGVSSSVPGTIPTPTAAVRPLKPAAVSKTPAAATKPAMGTGSGWRAQLGAYGSPAAAQAQWASLTKRIPALGGLKPSYEKAGAFTRLRAGPLASRAAADKICASVKAAGQPCFPVAP